MLESLVILYAIFGLLLFIVAIYSESVIFSGISILFWIIFMAGAVFIEVPDATGNIIFSEISSTFIALGMIFVNILWILVQYGYIMQDWQHP